LWISQFLVQKSTGALRQIAFWLTTQLPIAFRIYFADADLKDDSISRLRMAFIRD
jgi:hypothetical protein